MRPFLFLVVLLTACSPALDPAGAGYYYAGLTTATRMAADVQATAAPATQSAREYEYAQSLTATFAPLAVTATANANDSTRIANLLAAQRGTSEALYNQSAVTATQQALAVLESETQKRIADNNAAIARTTIGVEAWKFFLWGVAGIGVLGFGALVFISLWHGQGAMIVARQIFERRAWDKVELQSELEARPGFRHHSSPALEMLRVN